MALCYWIAIHCTSVPNEVATECVKPRKKKSPQQCVIRCHYISQIRANKYCLFYHIAYLFMVKVWPTKYVPLTLKVAVNTQRDNSLWQAIKSSKKTGTTPCHVWEGHTLKVLVLPSSSFRTHFSQGSNGDLDQQSPRSLDMWIELDVFLFDSSNMN